jgi:hypothetical protein
VNAHGRIEVKALTLEDAKRQIMLELLKFLSVSPSKILYRCHADTVDVSGPGEARVLVGYWNVEAEWVA